MVTLKPVVFSHHRRQDGTFPVKIRLTHNRQNKYIATTLTARPQDLTRSLKIKSPSLQTGCEALMQDIRSSLAKLSPFALDEMDAGQVVDFIRADQSKQGWKMDFFVWADSWIAKQSEGSRRNYKTAVNALERFIGRRSLDINAITVNFLRQFQEHLDVEKRIVRGKGGNKEGRADKITGGVAVIYLKRLGVIYHSAQERYNDEDKDLMLIPRDPFRKFHGTPKHGDGQPSIGLELMQKMIDAQPQDERQRYALDLFILSFLFRGVNMADLYELEQEQDGWIEWRRSKSRTRREDRAYYRMRVPDEARPYLERLKGRRRLLNLCELWKDVNGASPIVNGWLRRWEKDNKTEDFTMYAVRHTYASIAYNDAGLDKAMVDDLLGHKGDHVLADIYIKKDWEVLNTAHRKVLNLLRWHD